jgi:hypothetical protein
MYVTMLYTATMYLLGGCILVTLFGQAPVLPVRAVRLGPFYIPYDSVYTHMAVVGATSAPATEGGVSMYMCFTPILVCVSDYV